MKLNLLLLTPSILILDAPYASPHVWHFQTCLRALLENLYLDMAPSASMTASLPQKSCPLRSSQPWR